MATEFLDVQIVDASDRCENCAEWGRTVTREDSVAAVACPKCKRLTWPNLGVNLPAGCAWAIAGTNSAARRANAKFMALLRVESGGIGEAYNGETAVTHYAAQAHAGQGVAAE
jgi:hypothetical protein